MKQPPNYKRCVDGNPWLERISDERLGKMSTNNLLSLYKKLRSAKWGYREWDKPMGPDMVEYLDMIKTLLDIREHVKRNTPSGDNITQETRFWLRKKRETLMKKRLENRGK